jgi:hypothetical protein
MDQGSAGFSLSWQVEHGTHLKFPVVVPLPQMVLISTV